jgi:uncharacterized protein YjbI with pentapeptide repeats
VDSSDTVRHDALVVTLVFGCVAILVVVAFIIVAYRRRWAWTGFVTGPERGAPDGQTSKSLWDWLQLLIVPLALALAAFALNAAQDRREREREDKRAARELASADDRTREEALRGYLAQMSNLITEHRLRSVRATLSNFRTDAQALARTSTLTVLRRLDGERKGLVLQFLREAELINVTRHWQSSRGPRCARPRDQLCWEPQSFALALAKVNLGGADLRGAGLRGGFFAEWTEPTYGPGARVSARIRAADLSGADLRNADLRNAEASGVNFDRADLRGADFGGASLAGATFNGACLTGARFDHAILSARPDPRGAPPSAHLGVAQGQRVDFQHASLDRVDLRGTTLSDIDLSGASQNDTMFPRGWTQTGLRMSEKRAAALCERFSR